MSGFFGDDEDQADLQNESFFSPPKAGPSRITRNGITSTRGRSRPTVAAAPAPLHDQVPDNDLAEDVVTRLTRRWMNERNSPDLLQFDPNGELNTCLQTLMLQQEAVNNLRSELINMSEVEHLQLLLVQQDNERIKWLVNSLLRTRLKKIEQQFILLSSSDEYKLRLSEEESAYLARYHSLYSSYAKSSIFDTIPGKYGSLDDNQQMIFEPDLDSACYVLAMRECGPIRLPDGKGLHFERGSIHMVRYRQVTDLVKVGDLQLI